MPADTARPKPPVTQPRQDTASTREITIPLGAASQPLKGDTATTSATPLPELPPQGPDQQPPQGPDQQPDTTASLPPVVISTTPIEPIVCISPSVPDHADILAKGQLELKAYQQLYSQNRYFDRWGHAQAQDGRASYYTGIGSVWVGLGRKVNVGADIWLKSGLVDNSWGTPWKLFAGGNGDQQRTAVYAIAPKVKFKPSVPLGSLSLQTALLIPVAKNLAGQNLGRPFLGLDEITSWTQANYRLPVGRHWYAYAELGLLATANRKLSLPLGLAFTTPLMAHWGCTVKRKIAIFAMGQVWPRMGIQIASGVWCQAGLGGKWFINSRMDLELLYGRLLAGRSIGGPANVLNLGFRWVVF